MRASAAESVRGCANELKFSWIRDNIEDFLAEAHACDWTTDEAIAEMFRRECAARRANAIRRKMRMARFPYKMDFAAFETAHLAPSVQAEVRRLSSLDFMEAAGNVILVGNPGVGKTALAVAIGTRACEENRRVLFVNVSDLVIEIKEAMSLNEITRYKRSFERYDLVVLDDLGYCSFNRECGEVLFNLISSRNRKGSTVITTNLTFDRWNEVFDDPVLTGAIVDRVAHKAHIVDMTGDSYRVLETERWMEGVREASAKK